MSEVKYTDKHEWIRIDGDVGVVGITAYAAEQLGDVVYVELPEPGKAVAQFAEAAVVESVKAASEIYAPLAGEITDVNGALADNPALINEDPAGDGWFFKLRITDASGTSKLMDDAAYQEYVEGQS